MTDRELLELAAKAAGIDDGVLADDNDGYAGTWDPLTYDGDALRLAVKLRIDVMTHGCTETNPYAKTLLPLDAYSESNYETAYEETEEVCPYAATRRAIVRAAAEIGRHMK